MIQLIIIGVLLMVVAGLSLALYATIILAERSDDTIERMFDDYWRDIDDIGRKW